jgi:uncharacterized membrane protein YeaQ/YmgE (transglycosylase-associated protein family)
MNTMGWFTWLIIGAVAGWLVNSMWSIKFQHNLLINVLAGMIGALVGGLLFYRLGMPDAVTFNIWSLALAFMGAVVVLSVIRITPTLIRTVSSR